ncbi:hypothetical protein [Pollutimonas sp. M17]|nr:hypothetical protein [Pollutimonas sp. M17]UYO94080.1 hypothetical protein OEG81_01745 [Pollutimonas sp. M17]HWK69214.1 hypothetical protein [Burkholderiaceae bacterium]
MHRSPSTTSRGPRTYRGSALLASCIRRMAYMLLAIAFLWCLTAWALQWW